MTCHVGNNVLYPPKYVLGKLQNFDFPLQLFMIHDNKTPHEMADNKYNFMHEVKMCNNEASDAIFVS
jgi:hypothetical protein